MSTPYQPQLINEPSSGQNTAIGNHNLNNSPGSMPQPQLNSVSQRPQQLKLSQLPPPTAAHSAVMSASPTSRRRAALTPSQSWRHATGSYYPPEPHVNDEWVYRSTDTIPEASSSSSGSNAPSSPKPEIVSVPVAELPVSPASFRPRSYSYAGGHYSSAHRRVPSSPSFSSAMLGSHSYFDRPPSPSSSSVSSRSSEPTMKTSLSLTEMLASTATLALSNATLEPNEHVDPARREEQREERRLAMQERHAALRELRDRNKWAKAQARC